MIQQLIILGFLKKSPASGYDIKKFIDKDLGIFSKPETKSIYYPLKKMESDGLIKKQTLKTAKHLKKYIYSITPKGQRVFIDLCKQTLLSQRRPFIESDLVLYFLPFLKKKEIVPLLRLRLVFLEKVKNWLILKSKELKKSPKNLPLLLEHHLKLAIAEKEFLKDLLSDIKNKKI